jgi:hypothetical protein
VSNIQLSKLIACLVAWLSWSQGSNIHLYGVMADCFFVVCCDSETSTLDLSVFAVAGGASTVPLTFSVTFTLPEAAASNTVKLTIQETTGKDSTTHVLTLSGKESAAAQTYQITNGSALSDGALVAGGVYTFTLSYQDTLLNPAKSLSRTGISYGIVFFEIVRLVVRFVFLLRTGWVCFWCAVRPDSTSTLSCVPTNVLVGGSSTCTITPRLSSNGITTLASEFTPHASVASNPAVTLGTVTAGTGTQWQFTVTSTSGTGPVSISDGVSGSPVALTIYGELPV